MNRTRAETPVETAQFTPGFREAEEKPYWCKRPESSSVVSLVTRSGENPLCPDRAACCLDQQRLVHGKVP